MAAFMTNMGKLYSFIYRLRPKKSAPRPTNPRIFSREVPEKVSNRWVLTSRFHCNDRLMKYNKEGEIYNLINSKIS